MWIFTWNTGLNDWCIRQRRSCASKAKNASRPTLHSFLKVSFMLIILTPACFNLHYRFLNILNTFNYYHFTFKTINYAVSRVLKRGGGGICENASISKLGKMEIHAHSWFVFIRVYIEDGWFLANKNWSYILNNV